MAQATQDTKQQQATIFAEPAVARRVAQQRSLHRVTANSTIAAAVMVFAALLAVIVANSPAYELVHEVLLAPLAIKIGPFAAGLSFEGFTNDFLMAIFFLLVGIELKYEMTVGQLKKPRQAALPMLAACGGVAAPAIIFLLFNHGLNTANGWAIPIATDIAFALGVMSLLGDRIVPQTKVFFQTLAIADDILAIVVLALFYGQTINIAWCAAALGVMLLLGLFNLSHIYTVRPYMIVGLFLWICLYNSGIHATLAGVILAFFLPVRSDLKLDELGTWIQSSVQVLDDAYDDESHILGQHAFMENAHRVERVMHHATPPLQRVERSISAPVNFVILPLFAFVNAQIRLVGADPLAIAMDPVARGVYFGAVLGKPIGIILVTFVLVKIGFAKLPQKVDWPQIIAVGIMGGLGFTMSILISGLAFANPAETMAAKCAILLGSLTSGLLGIIFVRVVGAVKAARSATEPSHR